MGKVRGAHLKLSQKKAYSGSPCVCVRLHRALWSLYLCWVCLGSLSGAPWSILWFRSYPSFLWRTSIPCLSLFGLTYNPPILQYPTGLLSQTAGKLNNTHTYTNTQPCSLFHCPTAAGLSPIMPHWTHAHVNKLPSVCLSEHLLHLFMSLWSLFSLYCATLDLSSSSILMPTPLSVHAVVLSKLGWAIS